MMPPVDKDMVMREAREIDMLRAIIEVIYARMVRRESPVVSIAYGIGCKDVVYEIQDVDGRVRRFKAEVVVTEILCTTD